MLIVTMPAFAETRSEHLTGAGNVKGTMLRAHLVWTEGTLGDPVRVLEPHLAPDLLEQRLRRPVLSVDWVPFAEVMAVDRAIARAAGGRPESTWRLLGRHSATTNLAGAYRGLVLPEPHRFFRQSTVLHRRFQDFGTSAWTELGPTHGRMAMTGYPEFSPIFCASAIGYFYGVLAVLLVGEKTRVTEVSCQCAGEPSCVFDLSW